MTDTVEISKNAATTGVDDRERQHFATEYDGLAVKKAVGDAPHEGVTENAATDKGVANHCRRITEKTKSAKEAKKLPRPGIEPGTFRSSV